MLGEYISIVNIMRNSRKISTEKKIILATCTLLKKTKSWEAIKLIDIVKESKLSKSTFYNYFESKQAIKEQSLFIVLDEITIILYRDLSFGDEVLLQLFNHLKDNQYLLQLLIQYYPNFGIEIKKYIRTMLIYSNIEYLSKRLETSYQIPEKFAINVYTLTIESIILDWIRSDCFEEPKEMVDILRTAIKISK